MSIKPIKGRDIRQNKTDRVRKLLSIQQCSDCDFYDRQIEVLQLGQKYEVLKAAASNECPNCKGRNFAAVISEEDAESSFNLNTTVFELTLSSRTYDGILRNERLSYKPGFI